MEGYTIKDLDYWDERIQAMLRNFGLNYFPQEFEICDYYQMLGYLAYSGMPSHYPHWSFGKSFEKQKTLYDYGVSGLPYEMVINSNPALAYLMKDNSLLLQILTIAHVYGHNDFFKNNKTFRFSNPEYAIEMFKSHAERIRNYTEDPSIGQIEVEKILDACHALSLNCSHNLEIKKLTREEQKQRILEKSNPKKDEFSNIHEQEKYEPPDLTKIPFEPEENILLFLRDNNPYLLDWQRDIITIVAEETNYFLPQMETKIMNEGWATFWHYKILKSLELPQGLHTEFMVRHNQVIRPTPGGINPYFVGFKIFEDIEKRKGMSELFTAREAFRDTSFIGQYLTENLMAEVHFFAHENHDEHNKKITDVSDKDGWKKVKDILLQNIGLSFVPSIKILDANFRQQQTLYLWHDFDGGGKRDLEFSYAEQTLKHLQSLWGIVQKKKVILESKLEGKPVFLSYDGEGSVKITYQLLT